MPLNPLDYTLTVPPSLVQESLLAAFEGTPNPVLLGLLDLEHAGAHLTQFSYGPVFSYDGTVCTPRLTVSDVGDSEGWLRRVKAQWSSAQVDAFLSRGPNGCRRMVDTDGETTLLYLDDLQDVTHRMESPLAGVPLLCASYAIGDGEETVMTRHEHFPESLLLSHAPHLISLRNACDMEGVWGIRWQGGEAISLLCVTEVRTRSGVDRAIQAMAALPASDGQKGFCKVMRSRELRPYPDSVEFFPSGRLDVTLGVLAPR